MAKAFQTKFNHCLSIATVKIAALAMAIMTPLVAHADTGAMIADCEKANPAFPQLCTCAVTTGLASGIPADQLNKLVMNEFIGVSPVAVQMWGPIYANCTASAVAVDLGTTPVTPAPTAPQTQGSGTQTTIGPLQPTQQDPAPTGQIADGFYGIGPVGGALQVEGDTYSMGDEGGTYYRGPISELTHVGPNVVWVGNPNAPSKGNYYCADPYPTHAKEGWVEPSWCSEWGWVSGEATGLYPPQGDRLRAPDFTISQISGGWFCRNCGRPWTLTIRPDGTMVEASANGRESTAYNFTLLGGRALLRVSPQTGLREVLLIEYSDAALDVKYGSYIDIPEGNLMLRDY